MPFGISIELLNKIVIFVDTQIKKNDALNKSIKKENNIFFLNLKRMSEQLGLMIDKLKSYQSLSPTTEEISDLKLRCEKIFNNLKITNDLMIQIEKNHTELINKREIYKNKWYLCVTRCYTKSMFLEDLQNLNNELNIKLKLLNEEFDNLAILMNIYEKQIENLKFKFLPLRRLWISNKWDNDTNQLSQRVTIASFIQEIQAKETTNSTWQLHNYHFENMHIFLTNMIEVDKTDRQKEAIGLGRGCGTYFLNSSLIANLTNLPSDKLNWLDLSDMVRYFSIQPIEKPTDDKINQEIINKYIQDKNIVHKTIEETVNTVEETANTIGELVKESVEELVKESVEYIHEQKQLDLIELKNQNQNQIDKIDKIINSNIELNISEIIQDNQNKKLNAYVIKNGIKYIITYKQQSNHTTIYNQTEQEGKLGQIELDLQIKDSYNNNNDNDILTFIKKKYEGNNYFCIDKILWHKGTGGHEYSLHYNVTNDIWYLSRFNYSIDTINGYSGIFVHNYLNNYQILKMRGTNEIIKCNFILSFE